MAVLTREREPDILVNNAGVYWFRDFTEVDEKFEKIGDVVGSIFGSLVHGLMSVPDLKVTTTYKDGTSETKTHNPLFWLGAFLWIFVPLMLVAYYITLAPLAVSIAYYGNYVRNK